MTTKELCGKLRYFVSRIRPHWGYVAVLLLSASLCSMAGAAGEVRFNKGKLWLSKSTLKEVAEQKAQASSSAKVKASSAGAITPMATDRKVDTYRVFDLSVAMYRERMQEERVAFGIVFTNFAYAVYEATDGHHKIGRITILDRKHAGSADVSWEMSGRAHSQVNTADGQGRITMYDYFTNASGVVKRDIANETHCVDLGYTLAHEWSHGIYGLFDEYAEKKAGEKEKDLTNDRYFNTRSNDEPVVPSIMNNQHNAVDGGWKWLNYSIAYDENATVCGAFMNTLRNCQDRVYGQSCWEQLRSPKRRSNWDGKEHFWPFDCWKYTTPDFPEFKSHSVTAEPTIELDKPEAFAEATSELEIIWGGADTTVAVALDVSGSMDASDVANVKARAQELIARAPIGTIMSVVTFNTSIKTIFPFTEISAENRAGLQSKISSVGKKGKGGTALWDTSWTLLTGLEGRDGDAVKSIVLLTDGMDKDSSRSKSDITARCKLLGVSFNAIAYGSGADSELRSAAEETGGQYFSASQDPVSLSQAFYRSFAYSSSLETLVDVYYPTVSAPISQSFAVDSTLTNLQASVVVSKGAASDVVAFVAPDGTRYAGTKTVSGSQATYTLGVDAPTSGEWKIEATLNDKTSASVYVDAGSVAASVRVSNVIDEENAGLCVRLDLGNSIEGAQVTACVPCKSGVREVAFEDCGYGCYALPIARCGSDITNQGVTVRCEMRKGVAHLNLSDGLVSPAPDTEDDSLPEDFVRSVHFSVSDLAKALTNVVFDSNAFSVQITGMALVPDHTNYDPAKLTFVDPSTPLTVPFGTSVVFRVSYDFPDGYSASVWTRDCYAEGEQSYGQYFGSNPSRDYKGKGIAYGFLSLRENIKCPTVRLRSVAVRSMVSPSLSESASSVELSRTAVDLTFLGTGQEEDPEPAGDPTFSAQITGMALVPDHTNYDPAKLTFVDPSTPLTVPFGTSVVFRVNYDYPDGYSATVWTRDRYADGEQSYLWYFGSNPSCDYRGKGVAYGFLVLREDIECPVCQAKLGWTIEMKGTRIT